MFILSAKPISNVTIVDVAREAGVSHATVSRVLNASGYAKASTRDAVLQAVEKLGYVANQSARGLAGASSKLIGLLLPDFSGSYVGLLAEQVDEELYKAGYDLAVFPHHSRTAREKALIERTTTGLLDGLIIMVMETPDSYLELLTRRTVPFVLIGSEQASAGQPVVSQTNFQGAYDATNHLIQLGHRRIAFLRGPGGRASSLDREAGYRSALLDAEIAFDPALVTNGEYLRQGGYESAQRLLDLPRPPTAIFAGNDISAIGAMEAARARGLAVPADLSLIGFDDVNEASVVLPRLTTVRAPMRQMAREAVRMLLKRLEDPQADVRSVTLATQLIVRESTAEPTRNLS